MMFKGKRFSKLLNKEFTPSEGPHCYVGRGFVAGTWRRLMACFWNCLLCGATVPWAFGSTCRQMGHESIPLLQHRYSRRSGNSSNYCLRQVIKQTTVSSSNWNLHDHCRYYHLLISFVLLVFTINVPNVAINMWIKILASVASLWIANWFDTKDLCAHCCSNAYYLNPHLSKRTWALIFGAASLSVDLLPTLHNFRIFSFVGVLTTTYTSWYMLSSAIAHGQVNLIIFLFYNLVILKLLFYHVMCQLFCTIIPYLRVRFGNRLPEELTLTALRNLSFINDQFVVSKFRIGPII